MTNRMKRFFRYTLLYPLYALLCASCAFTDVKSATKNAEQAVFYDFSSSGYNNLRKVVYKTERLDKLSRESNAFQIGIFLYDFDHDGEKDFIAYTGGSLTCGSSGCSTAIFLRRKNGYEKISEGLVTNLKGTKIHKIGQKIYISFVSDKPAGDPKISYWLVDSTHSKLTFFQTQPEE
jgi:hypothetical protein